MFDLLIGRRVKMYGAFVASKRDGHEAPAVAMKMWKWWFDYEMQILDVVSFLLFAEKFLEHRENTEFLYKNRHDKLDITVKIPAWAVRDLQYQIASFAPKLYQKLKDEDVFLEKAIAAVGTMMPEDIKEAARKNSLLAHYKRLHAELHNYKQEEHKGQVIH